MGRDGIRTEYGEDGRLSRMLDVNGEAVALEYDLDNSVQTVRDIYGNPTTYVYDNRGNVLTEIDPVGLQTVRTYDERNNVLSETMITAESGPEGWTTTYTYDGQNNKLSETDSLGRTTYSTYGQYGRLLTETDPLGNTTSYDYDSRGNLLSSADGLGNVTSYDYDSRGNLLTLTDANNQVTHFGYDTQGNVTSVTDTQGNITTYTYDANGNRTSETRQVPTTNGLEDAISQWQYDSEGQILFYTDPERLDPNNPNNPANATTTYTYDAAGNQTQVTDARGNSTQYIYDEKGQRVVTIYADGTANPEDNPRTVTLYDKGGRERASIDADGTITHYRYDIAGRLIETIYGDETSLETLLGAMNLADGYIPTAYTMGAIDWTKVVYPIDTPAYITNHATLSRTRTEYTQDGRVQAEVDELGNRTEYRYNDLGQLLEVIAADGDSDPNNNPSMTYRYDAAGRRTHSTDANGYTTEYRYDTLGRLRETIFADGTSISTQYDQLGRRIASTDPEGQITEYEYDNLGRLTKVIQTLDGRQLETEYGYDSAGRLIWQEDANNNRTSYEYDLLGRRTVVQLPTGERSVTTYDEVGNVATVKDFNGETIQFVYDEQNRLEDKILPDDVDVQYAYTPEGQIASITDERGTTSFDYDAQGRLIARKDPTSPYLASGNSIEYEYDDAGNISQVRTAAGVATYTYDEQNRLETVTEDGDTTTYVYDLAGNLKETQFPNGVIERRTYDELNRLDVLETEKDGILLSRFDYTVNDAGHRLEVVESVRQLDGTLEERTVRYEYDDLYRLISEEVVGGDTTTYTYDDVGNRVSQTVGGVTTTYTYDANDRLETEVSGGTTIEYKYDKNGNLTERKENGVVTATYVWDDQNRMVQVQTPTETVTYKYDDDNIRVSETTASGTKSYVLDKNRPYAQVLAEYEDGNLEASYTYGLDLIEQERDGNESYYSVDGLGSTRGLTDENGEVTDTYIYDAYGNVIGSSGSTENDYRFAGEQWDGTLGQYYLRQRYYDPQSGRFTRRDTYEGRHQEPITLHKYLYANADPVNGIDPSGLFTLTEVLAGSAAIGGLVGAVGGGYYGTQQSGEFFSEETLKFALIGLVGGAAAGALLGGAIYLSPAGLGPVLKTGLQQLWRKMLVRHTKTMSALAAGFGFGFTGGILEPDYEVSLGTALTTALAIGDDALVRGAIWKRHTIARVFGETFKTHARQVLQKYVQSTTFITLGFLLGFTIGYTSGSTVRKVYDAQYGSGNN